MLKLFDLTGDVIVKCPLILSGNARIKDFLSISGNIIIGGGKTHKTYNGEYEIVPKVYQQLLETDDKLMADDLTVKAITYNTTSNEKGGLTAQIGEV